MQAQRKLSPAERAANFARATRKYEQVYPSLSPAAGTTVRFSIDKVRLLHKIRLYVTATLTAVHASNTSYTPATLAPYTLIKNIRVISNMSFTPWISSGIGAYLLMLGQQHDSSFKTPVYGTGTPTGLSQVRAWAYQGTQSAPSAGTANPVSFVLDIPIAVNERDPIGMILTQNQETKIDVELDLGTANDIAPASAGYTFTLSNLTITPYVETFSVPLVPEAIPDLTIVKTVGEINEITVANRHVTKLPTGATYRRVMWYYTDTSTGAPIADSTFNSNFEVVLNQSDIPVRIPAAMLQRKTQEMLGGPLPAGVFAWDLTYQGLVNYGGSRDYVDTERLTEFWLVTQNPSSVNLKVVYETLARMGG